MVPICIVGLLSGCWDCEYCLSEYHIGLTDKEVENIEGWNKKRIVIHKTMWPEFMIIWKNVEYFFFRWIMLGFIGILSGGISTTGVWNCDPYKTYFLLSSDGCFEE